jgi:hypothetical protein
VKPADLAKKTEQGRGSEFSLRKPDLNLSLLLIPHRLKTIKNLLPSSGLQNYFISIFIRF